MNEEIKQLIIDKVANLEENGSFDIEIEYNDLVISAKGSICRQFKNDKCGYEPDCFRLVSREVLFSEICICGEDFQKYLTVAEIYNLQNELKV